MKRRETLSPDLTPLIDVVFILLIFFIVSSVFKKEELALALNLPDSNGEQLEVELKQLSIELSKDSLAYMGKKLSFEQLNKHLSNIKNNKKDIIVRIDKDVAYHRVVKVLDILQKYNLNNLALVTKQ
jgi:biopolymer transport protein ExbD